MKKSILMMIMVAPIVALAEPAADELAHPDTVDLSIRVRTVSSLHEGQSYSIKGLTGRSSRIHGANEIEVISSDENYAHKALRRGSISVSSVLKEGSALDGCRKHFAESLANPSHQFSIRLSSIPFGHVYNMPGDWVEVRQLEAAIKRDESAAKNALALAEKNHLELLRQIEVARKALAAAKDSKSKQKLKAQLESLEKRAETTISTAREKHAKIAKSVAERRERADKLYAKIESRLSALAERAAKATAAIEEISKKIAKAEGKGDAAAVEKLKVNLMMEEDKLEKSKAEEALLRPGLRSSFAFNADRMKISCE